MADISMIKCPKCEAEYQNFLATQLKAELDTLQASRNRLIDSYKEAEEDLKQTEICNANQYEQITKLKADLAAAKDENGFLERQYKNTNSRIERLLRKLTSQNKYKANLKLCKADIKLRKDYESYLQSTAGPMYSYNSWKKQKGDQL